MKLLVTFDDAALRQEIEGLDEVAAGAFRTQVVGALNRVGAELHQAIIAPLRMQTGLSGSTVPRSVHDVGASEAEISYSLVTRGGDISLKYFNAREERGGVLAFPWGNVRTFVAGAFIKSGRGANRRLSPKLNGQVFRNVAGGVWRGKIKKVKSGVFIPNEMVIGETAAVFQRVVAEELPPAVGRVLTLVAGRRG
ncbi:hypothetical protein [Methylosinus sp. PW1]|uniref:hypothetical protein n=1 Tax=Methylosinus sp. PW1 TaxID=107636 RepID=UPI00068A036B|nr:hypothetical protein [Methylosinus sp. PW1]